MKGEERDTTMANTGLCASRVYTYVYVSACVRVRETEQRGEVERGAHADSRRGTGQPRRRRRERRGEAGERRWRYAVKPWEPTAARASRSPLLSSHLHLSFYRIAPTAPAASRSIASAAAQPPLLLLSSPSVVSSRFYSSYLSRARKRIQNQNKSGFPPSSLRPDRLYRLLRISTPLPLSSTSYTSSLVFGNRRYRCTSSTQTYTYTYIHIAVSQGALFPRGENRACLFSTAIPRRFHSDPP